MELERAQRLVRLRCWGYCEGCGRGGLVLSVHHRQARGAGGVHRVAAQVANDPRNLLCLCGRCHEETEHAQTWSLTEEIGWRIPKWVREPFLVPALLFTTNYAGQAWYLLDMEGGYTWIDPLGLPELPQASWRVEQELPNLSQPWSVSAKARRIVWHGSNGG